MDTTARLLLQNRWLNKFSILYSPLSVCPFSFNRREARVSAHPQASPIASEPRSGETGRDPFPMYEALRGHVLAGGNYVRRNTSTPFHAAGAA